MSNRIKKGDAVEAVFTIAAIWLALRGDDAEAIGSRGLAAARAAEETRKRLEAYVMNSIRQHCGCNQPNPCNCVVCSAYAAEHKIKETKATERAS